jgi:succinate dehydrogenase / fumarate reductase flavoprotein subunit
MASTTPRIVVVGGGLAGLMAAIKSAEAGATVDLISLVPVKRSHSACAQGGINGAVNTKGEGDSPEIHFYDTVKGGDFVAHQPLCKAMAYAAPGIIYLMDRMGVTFNRTQEGNLDFRRFGGTLHHRTAFAGASTGQQLLYALDEQARRHEAEGRINKFEYWEFIDVIKDGDGRCRGALAMDLRRMKMRVFPASAVILATGGPGLVYGRSTNSSINTGSAAMAAYRAGVKYANGEYIQIHPTAIPGNDKLRLMSEAARGEGGRVWVPRSADDKRAPKQIPEAERWYFLEERYPRFGNLVPRDVASREIYDVCINHGLGIGGKSMVYLDLTHKPAEELDKKIKGIMEIYEKFAGEDPRHEPMKIFPAVHYSMGGMWVDYEATANGMIAANHPKNHSTNVPGLYAAGECEYQYHGANRLGANALLSCIYAGSISGPAAVAYAKNGPSPDEVNGLGEKAVKAWEKKLGDYSKREGGENPFAVWREMGEAMIANVLIVRENKRLKETLDKLYDYKERVSKCHVPDGGSFANQSLMFLYQLENMVELALVIAKGALLRDECRGAHYKPDFLVQPPDDFKPETYVAYAEAVKPENAGSEKAKAFLAGLRPDEKSFCEKAKKKDDEWLKTTIATYSPDGPVISYEPVNTSLLAPRPRKYD